MDKKVISVIPGRCIGCKQCELICSYVHEGCYSLRLSRIKVMHFEDKGLSVPITCTYCEKPVCQEVCPVEAITNNSLNGVAEVNEELCIGCKKCVNACPLGAIDLHPQKGVVVRCDLCDGDPACVKYCPVKALTYVSLYIGVKSKRRARMEAWNLE